MSSHRLPSSHAYPPSPTRTERTQRDDLEWHLLFGQWKLWIRPDRQERHNGDHGHLDEYWWNATHRDDVRLGSLQFSRLPGAGCRWSRQLRVRSDIFREDLLAHIHDGWNVLLLLLHTAPVYARRDNSSMSRKEPEKGPVHPSRTNLHNPLSLGFSDILGLRMI